MNREMKNCLGMKNSNANLTSMGAKILPQELIFFERQKHYMPDLENVSDGKSINNQENHVEENSGITGITGTGHTITINQCPKEIIEILSKLIEITKINGI